MVGVALFAMITSLIAVAFTLAHRYMRVYHQLSTAQRECSQCLTKMGQMLERGKCDTLQPASPVNACWFLSAIPPVTSAGTSTFDGTTGELQYHKWQAVYLVSDGQVVAAEVPLAAPAVFEVAMVNAAPTAVTDFLFSQPKRVLARSIRRFAVRAESPRLLQVEVEAQTTESGNPATRYLLTSSFPGQ